MNPRIKLVGMLCVLGMWSAERARADERYEFLFAFGESCV